MSNSDKIIQTIADKQRQAGLWKNLGMLAVAVLLGYSLYQGSADLQEDLLGNAETALHNSGVDTKKIKLQLEGRDARLIGLALDQASADQALAAVSRVPGIASVDQRIVVASSNATGNTTPTPSAPSGPQGTHTDDSNSVTSQTSEKKVSVSENSVPHISAHWQDGKLTLSGALGSNKEMSELLVAARNSYPPGQLDNQIRIEAGLPEAQWLTSFTRHLPELKYQQQASMESSASSLLPKQPDQTRYVIADNNSSKKPAPPANALALNTAANNASLPAANSTSARASRKHTNTSTKTASTPTQKTRGGVKHSTQKKPPAPTTARSTPFHVTPETTSGSSLHFRSHMGRVAINGVLSSAREANMLSHALRMAYPPSVTLNQIRVNPGVGPAVWLDGLNKSWLLTQPVEWLELEIDNKVASLSGWVITDELGKRIADTLAAQVKPIPVHNQMRSISSQQHSVAAARMLNSSFARNITFRRQQPNLSWDGHQTLTHVAKLLRNQPTIRLVIGVHSDASNDPRQALYLSQKRAQVIKQRLISLGIRKENLMAIGYGSNYPIADNATPGGRTLNQRVEFTPM